MLKKFTSLFLIVFFFSLSVLGNFDKILTGQVFVTKLSFAILVFLLSLSLCKERVSVSHLFVFILFFIGLFYFFLVANYKGVDDSNALKELLPYSVPMVSLLIINAFDSRRFELVQANIMKVILIFALIHVVVSLTSKLNPELYSLAYYSYNDWSNESYIGDFDNSFWMLRVQFGYSLILLLGLLLSIDDIQDNKALSAKIYCFIFFISILATQSRALIIGAVLSPVLFVIIKMLISTFNNSIFRVAGLLFAVLSPSLIIFVSITTDVVNSLGLSRGVGDGERLIQLKSFLAGFNYNPILGGGFGSHFGIIRNAITPWIYELNILSVIFKLGVIGWLLLMVFLLCFFISIVGRGKVFNVKKYSLYLTFLFVVVFVSNSNPYLANFCGAGILMFILTKIGFLERDVKCKG